MIMESLDEEDPLHEWKEREAAIAATQAFGAHSS